MSDLNRSFWDIPLNERKQLFQEFQEKRDFELCAKIIENLLDFSWEFSDVHSQNALKKAVKFLRDSSHGEFRKSFKEF